MNEEVAKTDAVAIRPPKERDTALAMLPKEWRHPVSFFYGFHAEILKGTLCLATRFKFWIKENDLTLDEAKAAMRKLMQPEIAGSVEFGSQQLQGMLAQAVAAIVTARKTRQRTERRIQSEGDYLPGSQISELLKGVVRGVSDA